MRDEMRMKFFTGDVILACRHFRTNLERAVVMGCYRDLHGGTNEDDYALEFSDDRQAWFRASELTLACPAESGEGMKLLKEWRATRYAKQDAEDLKFASG
jgi:hypothetical protein